MKITKEEWEEIWKKHDEWYQKNYGAWEDQQLKIAELVNKLLGKKS